MRLLNVRTLELHEFDSTDTPKYVIASHRWNKGAEASFTDVQDKRNTDKPGYRKVVGFARYIEAHIPGIEWLWIDTCCIDRRDSQELSEAINLMFRWYREAELCLAYLVDVTTNDIEEFSRSEWFKRGWTLQELLAPSTVVFLTEAWQVLGHKGGDEVSEGSNTLEIGPSLESTIAPITNVPEHILRDYEGSKDLSFEEKLNWVSGRKTTREEDIWYCLFGILNAPIGANYGEGSNWAKIRLMRFFTQSNDVPRTASNFEPRSPTWPGGDLGLPQRQEPSARLAQQRLLESLYFPQMEERKENIHGAFHGTYQWSLLSVTRTDVRWDNMVAWLSDPQPAHRTYWINAKPGAGKSSLVHFLDEHLRPDRHMQPWAQHTPILQTRYYFWSPGSPLQKSIAGLLRTILYQLLNVVPEMLQSCMPLHKWNAASAAGTIGTSWTDLELRQCLRKLTSALRPSVKILMLIDGLDEIDGDEDTRDELLHLLNELAQNPHIKICVSSRRWTVFQDEFASCPQLRLEDLNAEDINSYVRGQLQSQSRYQQMLSYDPRAEDLITGLIAKAEGVFLWIRLVVTELLRSIRDGDSLVTLQQKVESIPGDLSEYFRQLVESIEPFHRREASVLLQIALHQEHEFTTLHPLRLMDLFFIDEGSTDFSLGDLSTYVENFRNPEAFLYKLDTVLRRLHSRCKGLLECHLRHDSAFEDVEESPYEIVTSLPNALSSLLQGDRNMAFKLRVEFMHRSLRDYFLEPGVQLLLHQHTAGPFDARNYLRNSRLAQIFMSMAHKLDADLTVGLASYFICTLSIPSFRSSARCVQLASRLESVLEHVISDVRGVPEYWYLSWSLMQWDLEESNFFSLAIDFALSGYLLQTLTTDDVREKCGRPLLDHVLRPRFTTFCRYAITSIGNQIPNPESVKYLLTLGADPNQVYEGFPLSALFLCFVADCSSLYNRNETATRACFLSLEAMINGGAYTSFTPVQLGAPPLREHSADAGDFDYFPERWPALARGGYDMGRRIAITEILQCLGRMYGDRIRSMSTSVNEQAGAGAESGS